jgi:Fe-S cluster assembly protein SufB
LLLDTHARSDTYPTIIVDESKGADIGHEASVCTINDNKIWYLQTRGLTHMQARALIVNGFIDSFVDMLPMEYAVEINRLIAHQMEGSIG